jgi:hypothetical protein
MKRKMVIVSAVVILCLLQSAVALSKPDFTGTWVMDKNRSFSNPPGLEQTLNITHTGDQMKLESKLVTARGEQVINDSYTFDGKERDFAPPPGGPPGAKGKRTAAWLPEGRGILITDEITSDSPNGPVTQKVARKWTLSTDGSTLTIDYFFDNPSVSYEAKRVFVRKPG